jgi:hypothetical protein
VSTATADTQGVAINVRFIQEGRVAVLSKQTRLDQLDWQDYLTWTHKNIRSRGGFWLEYDNDRNHSYQF